jgi:hypothetical protein
MKEINSNPTPQRSTTTPTGRASGFAAKSSPEQFCFWLRGFLDGRPGVFSTGLSDGDTLIVAEALDRVFTHVAKGAIPPKNYFDVLGDPRTSMATQSRPSITTMPAAGQCQDPGDCAGEICDNPNCKSRPRLEALC